jgi:mono/diheme cytochrome c family protein
MKGNVRNQIAFWVLAVGAIGCAMEAQSGASVWDGVYSAEQTARGEELYMKQCASCHAADLSGSGQAPELSGDDFKKEWDGKTLGDLFDRIATTMPADRPGTLTAEQNADVIALVLKSNGFPVGMMELKGDSDLLKLVRFQAVRGKQ